MPDFSPFCRSTAELSVEQLAFTGGMITITAVDRREAVPCPACGVTSSRVHSCYHRTLADLPWQGARVRLSVTGRRFFCDATRCERRIFVERLPETAARYARRTCRATTLLELVGLALGGRTGARMAQVLGLASAPGTVLARLREAVATADLSEMRTPRVLGVDDWAMRRGQRYGTILVDLERHRVIDLLPDREAATLTAWLEAHPGVEVISRDRGGAYAEGARQGAPDAVQVADRFHLVHNLVDALERACTRHHAALKDAAHAAAGEPAVASSAAAEEYESHGATTGATTYVTAHERLRQERRARRLARYEEVIALERAGHSGKQIARMMQMHRSTVRTWLAAGCFPERARPTVRAPRLLNAFRTEVEVYYDAGGDNPTELTDQLRELGYPGARVTVWRALRALRATRPRAASGDGAMGGEVGIDRPPRAPAMRVPSSQAAAWMLRKPGEKLTDEERAYVTALSSGCPEIAEARALGDRFVHLLQDGSAADLDSWLAAAEVSELRSFAQGIRRDYAAVLAAITTTWSNGQVEGQVHRLKLVKRTMYGRAKFDLLRARVLRAA